VFEEARLAAASVERVTTKLIRLLCDSALPVGDRSQAIRDLTRLRSNEAIGPLLDNLLFIDPEVMGPGPLASFPAARALIHFGRPVYDSLWNEALRECSDDYLLVVAFVLQAMDGEDVAMFRLRERLDDPQTTPLQKRNLKHILVLIQDLDFTDNINWPNPGRIRRKLNTSSGKEGH
jgi:hypothetical protein